MLARVGRGCAPWKERGVPPDFRGSRPGSPVSRQATRCVDALSTGRSSDLGGGTRRREERLSGQRSHGVHREAEVRSSHGQL